MRNWFKTTPNASFSGREFYVEREQLDGGGRKVAIYEFAKAEDHDTDDMGRRKRTFRFVAYVVGDNADADAQAFVELCSTKDLVAELRLPMLGSYQVRCTTCNATADSRQQGKVDLDLEFVEAGNGSAFAAIPLGDRIAVSLMDGMAGLVGAAIGAFPG